MEELWIKTTQEDIENGEIPAVALQSIDDEHYLGRRAVSGTGQLPIEACLTRLHAYDAVKLGLSPELLSDRTLLPLVRERLIATFLTVATHSRIGGKLLSLQSAVALSLPYTDSDLHVLAYILAEMALFLFAKSDDSRCHRELEHLVLTLKPKVSELKRKGRSYDLQIWVDLLEAQSMVARGDTKSAIAHLDSSRDAVCLSLPVRVGRCITVSDGRCELILLHGLIHYQAGNFIAAWTAFQDALAVITCPTAMNMYSRMLIGAFLRLICPESPGFEMDMNVLTFSEQMLPLNEDHRSMLFFLARYLYNITQSNSSNTVDGMIWRFTQVLDETIVTAVSTYLSRVLEVTRQTILYQGSGLWFDYCQQLAESRSAFNPSAWLGPAVSLAP